MAFSNFLIGFHKAHLFVAPGCSLCENQLTCAKMPYVSTSHDKISIHTTDKRFTNDPPDAVNVSYAADVLKRNHQLSPAFTINYNNFV